MSVLSPFYVSVTSFARLISVCDSGLDRNLDGIDHVAAGGTGVIFCAALCRDPDKISFRFLMGWNRYGVSPALVTARG